MIPNEKADELAKKATNESSPQNNLSKSLQKPIPMSLAALCQEAQARFQHLWARRWKGSPRYTQLGSIDKSMLLKKWLKLVKNLNHKQASLIMQLHTNHIGLNKHLHPIHRADSLKCTNCNENTDKTVHHFLFECPGYRNECSVLQHKLWRQALNLSYLLTNPAATLPLLKFVHTTKHFKNCLGNILGNDAQTPPI